MHQVLSEEMESIIRIEILDEIVFGTKQDILVSNVSQRKRN